jgi:hypothetical protein
MNLILLLSEIERNHELIVSIRFPRVFQGPCSENNNARSAALIQNIWNPAVEESRLHIEARCVFAIAVNSLHNAKERKFKER